MKKDNILIHTLKALFGVYAVVIFILSHLITMPFYFIIFGFNSPRNITIKGHSISRFWAELLFIFYFIRVDIKKRELINPDQVYVFVSNHRSQLDILIFARACKNTFRFLSKVEITRIPLFGYMVKRLYIIVDRKRMDDRVKSFEKMKQSLLKDNISILIFPEGTRNRTKEPLIAFKNGAFRLAIETQLPIAPLAILNSGELLPPGKFSLMPGILKAVWCEPVDTKGMTLDDIPRLKEMVRDKLVKELQIK